MTARAPLEDRFWAKVNKTQDCWLWTATRVVDGGHGLIKNKHRMWLAHRISWELNVGPIPTGMCVLHKCDNVICVNPDHLFLGTQTENVKDCIGKGRFRKVGEMAWNARWTKEQVSKVRELYATGDYTQRQLSALYSMGSDTVSRIVNNKIWRSDAAQTA